MEDLLRDPNDLPNPSDGLLKLLPDGTLKFLASPPNLLPVVPVIALPGLPLPKLCLKVDVAPLLATGDPSRRLRVGEVLRPGPVGFIVGATLTYPWILRSEERWVITW